MRSRSFAKVNALNGAGVNDGRMGAVGVEMLVFVDVAQGHVIQPSVVDDAAAENQLLPQHDGALAAVFGALHAGVGGEDEGNVGIGRFHQFLHALGHPGLQLGEDIVVRFSGRFLAGHELAAGNPGHGDDLHRDAQFFRFQAVNAVSHVNVGHFQRVELVQGVGAPGGRRNVVIAYQQHRGNAGSRQAHDAPAPFALEGRVRIAVFVGIPGKDYQVNGFGKRTVYNGVQGLQEVHHAQGQSRHRVVTAVIGNVDVGVGKVQYAQGFGGCHAGYGASTIMR